MVAPTDKLPLTTATEDIEEYNWKHIDPQTGLLYRKKDLRPVSQHDRAQQKFDPHSVEPVDTEGL